MPGRKLVTHPADLLYLYDGSLPGFYSCVHASVYGRQMPLDIQGEGEAQASMLPVRWIETDPEKALRVREAIYGKVCERARELVENVFFTCLPQREMSMLSYILLAFESGGDIARMLSHPVVNRMEKAERHLTGEAHLLKGFIRFSDYEGKLVATIGPKNFVLPFLLPHFADRYANEEFMIYDKTHQTALIYEKKCAQIVQMDQVAVFDVSEEEARYRALWKHFYKTVGIAERENPRCRMTHMPKRYWAYMTEMAEFL